MRMRSMLIGFAIGLLAGVWGGRELYHYGALGRIEKERRIERLDAAGALARARAYEEQNRVLRNLVPRAPIVPVAERSARAI